MMAIVAGPWHFVWYAAFCYSYSSCCWISLSRYGNGAWFISTTVNLTRRSDNGRINSSPVSRSPAIVRWSEGCPSQSLRIPVEDADGDVVKCRYANYSESYFNNDSFPYGTFDEVISHLCVNCLYNLFYLRYGCSLSDITNRWHQGHQWHQWNQWIINNQSMGNQLISH